jgi:hypothetical protein
LITRPLHRRTKISKYSPIRITKFFTYAISLNSSYKEPETWKENIPPKQKEEEVDSALRKGCIQD